MAATARVSALMVHVALAKKAGLSFVDSTCDDAKALGLSDSWYYNWNSRPDAKGLDCSESPRTSEFVPMLWSCDVDCEKALPKDYWSTWMKTGVKFLLGFNEPDNVHQSNMTAEFAAHSWVSVQKIAKKFVPPLTLVSPAMTHWYNNGSQWLDDFFSNCTAIAECDPASIEYLAFHDYDGDADAIIAKADAAAKKYGRKVWLTEFSLGSMLHRKDQDAFMQKIIPALEKSDSVFRYAWYSTRNAPDVPTATSPGWVAESSLLPYYNGPFHKKSKHTCKDEELKWLSGKSWGMGDLPQCGAMAVNDPDCTSPLTIVYENGGDQNCYCAKSACTDTDYAEWQDRYVYTEASYKQIKDKVCTSDKDMLWLAGGDASTLEGCKAMAHLTGACAHPKTIAFQNGTDQNCYCAKTSTCNQVASDWLSLYVVLGSENATSLKLTSTGSKYKALTQQTVLI